jgi:hypothetical protein
VAAATERWSCAGAKFQQRRCPESEALPRRLLPQRLVVRDRLPAVNACLEGSKHADKMEVLIDVLQKLSNRLPQLHLSYGLELVAATS